MGNTTASVKQIIKDTIDYSSIETKVINPIVTIETSNDKKTVDVLLKECSDILDQRYKPWFAKRFYKLEKYSVLKAAAIARQDGKSSQKLFCDFVKKCSV